MKKRLIRLTALLLIASILGTSAYSADQYIAKENQRMTVSESYYDDIASNMKGNIYAAIANTDLSKELTEDYSNIFTNEVKDEIVASLSTEDLSDEAKVDCAKTVRDYLDNYDFSNTSVIKTTTLSETSRSALSSAASDQLSADLKGTKFEVNDGIVTAKTGDSVWAKRENNIADRIKKEEITGTVLMSFSENFQNELASKIKESLEQSEDSSAEDSASIIASAITEKANSFLNSKDTAEIKLEDTDLENIASNIIDGAKDSIQTACNDLTEQASGYQTKIDYCNESIASLNDKISELKTDSAMNDTDNETAIKDANDQIAELNQKKKEYEEKTNDLFVYSGFTNDSTVSSFASDDTDNINAQYNAINASTQKTVADIQTQIKNLEDAGYDTTELEDASRKFETGTNSFLNKLDNSRVTFTDMSLSGANLESYIQTENAALTDISDKYAGTLIDPDLQYGSSDDSSETADDSDSANDINISYTDTDKQEILDSIAELKTELKDFEKKYGDAINDVSDSVNAVSSVLNMMSNGGIYDSYTKELSEITGELSDSMKNLKNDNSDSREESYAKAIQDIINSYATETDTALSSMQSSVDNASGTIQSDIMNTGAFYTYQNYVAERVSSTTDTITALQTSVQTEAAERKTADEKLSQAIGSLRSDLTWLIGSSSISNVGSSITAAIGNTSLAGIGNGTLSGAISSLNSKIGSTDISKIGNGTVTGSISTLNSNINGLITTRSILISYSLASGTCGMYWVDTPSVSGYTAIGVIRCNSGCPGVVFSDAWTNHYSNGKSGATLYNDSGATVNTNCSLTILYVKNIAKK